MSDESTASGDELQVCFGTPTIVEMKRYLKNLSKLPLDRFDCSPDESTEESSFELDTSFQAMIERKRKELLEAKLIEAQQELQRTNCISPGAEASVETSNFRCNDSSFMEHDTMHKITDESFEEMERLCTFDQSKLEANQQLEEEDAIKRILEATSSKSNDSYGRADTQEAIKPLPTEDLRGLVDVTQLEEVEEPSCLWENSMLPTSTNTVISPVKRMHMIRPSTIIEEATINDTTSNYASKETSHDSYTTAKQNINLSDSASFAAGSEVYRTAEEGSDTKSSIGNTSENFSANFDSSNNKTRLETDLHSNTTVYVEDEDDVIILSSSDSEAEDMNDEPKMLLNKHIKTNDSTLLDSSSSLQENSLCLNDENASTHPESPLLDAIPDHFNDTLEEMEFMMRQGMKVMQQQKAQQHLEGEKPSLIKPLSSTKKGQENPQMTPATPYSPNRYLKPKQQNSSCKQTLFPRSASKINSAHKPGSCPSTGSNHAGAFKKPTISRFPLPKSAKKFDHIVSPIGAYIKKTPQTTLQARIFCPNQNLCDVLHGRIENRDSVISTKENHVEPIMDPSTYHASLPRKGVISSRGAHVLDERHVVRIPGGEKVHRLLNNSPTMVIRHEGRLKYQRETQLTDDSVADDSMADLSMASGDVSVRVIKDVKRF